MRAIEAALATLSILMVRLGGHGQWVTTMASLKVIALIGAWTSTVLLICLIVAIIMTYIYLPDNISTALNNGILFLRSINEGYALALHAIESPQSGRTLSEAIANQVQIFYDIPFEIIRDKFPASAAIATMNIFSQTPKILDDVQDMLWWISALLINTNTLGVIAPKGFVSPTERHYAC